ncbi:hypothetical protein, partial [Klebsiella pneumoniae]|uniref:hypothetical protein n=1 Tax=Klebsiella pneumoniae TaxID=573 RepID=UPI0039C4905B
ISPLTTGDEIREYANLWEEIQMQQINQDIGQRMANTQKKCIPHPVPRLDKENQRHSDMEGQNRT